MSWCDAGVASENDRSAAAARLVKLSGIDAALRHWPNACSDERADFVHAREATMTAVFSDLRYAIRQLRKRPVAEAALTERCGQPASIRRLVFSKPQLSLLSSGRELRFLLFGIRQFTFAPRRRSSLLQAQAPSEVRARGGRRVSAENHRSSRSPRLPWSSRSLLTALLTVISAPGSNPPRGV